MPLKMVIKIDQQHNLNSGAAQCCRSPYFFSRFLSLHTLVKNQTNFLDEISQDKNPGNEKSRDDKKSGDEKLGKFIPAISTQKISSLFSFRILLFHCLIYCIIGIFILHPQIFQFCANLVHILNKIWSSVMLWRAFLVFMAWLGCTFVSPPLLATIIQHSTTYFVGWKLWLTWIQWLFIFYWTRIYWKFEWLNVNLIDNFLMCAN